jgi:hypothetical protein
MMLLLGGKFLSMEYFSGERSGDMAVALSFLVMALVPFCYFTYVTTVVWRQKLLPLNGRTRAISIYFLCIIVFFFIFWIRGIVIPLTYTTWYLGALQSVMSFAAALTKRDMRSAANNLLTCCSKPRAVDSERESEQYTMRWSERRLDQQWTSARSLIMGGNSSMSKPSHSFRTPFASRRDSESSSQSDTTSVTVSFRTVYAHSRKLSSLTVLDEVEGAETNSTGGMNHEGGEEDELAPQSESAGNGEAGEAFCRAKVPRIYVEPMVAVISKMKKEVKGKRPALVSMTQIVQVITTMSNT